MLIYTVYEENRGDGETGIQSYTNRVEAEKKRAESSNYHLLWSEMEGEIERLYTENERLREGLSIIQNCKGAPDPAGSIETAIAIAKIALAGKEG